MTKLWRAPKLWLLADQNFYEPPDLPVNWIGPEASGGEKLVEFAGRLCYMSQENQRGFANAEYIENLIAQDHTSVLEHAVLTVLIQGVSRALSHELVRHRHNSPSQLSQRYVSWHRDAVAPPAVLGLGEEMVQAWLEGYEAELAQYDRLKAALFERGLRGKKLSEASRSLLPNACETKLVVTGNGAAWRHVLRKRQADGADSEIQRFAVALGELFAERQPAIYGGLK